MLSIFSHSCWPSVCLLWRNVYLDPLPICFDWLVYLILSVMSHLYSFEINFLMVASFEDVFSVHFARESDAGTGSGSK